MKFYEETWVHYLHIVGMVETGYFFRIHVKPVIKSKALKTSVSFNRHKMNNLNANIQTYVLLSFALISMNRALGIPDMSVLVISSTIV